MNSQTIQDAFAPYEAKYHAEVLDDAWGHLAPKRNKTYTGRIVYAVGCFGDDPLNPTMLVCDFDGLDSSPWFFDALNQFIQSMDNELGSVYEFKGTFRNYKLNGCTTLLQQYGS